METNNENRKVVCLAADNIDEDAAGACEEIGSFLLDSGWELVVRKNSPFIPKVFRAKSIDGIKEIDSNKPRAEDYKVAMGIIDFGSMHAKKSRPVVNMLSSALQSVTLIMWSKFNGEEDERLKKIMELTRRNEIPVFDIAEADVFDKIYSQI